MGENNFNFTGGALFIENPETGETTKLADGIHGEMFAPVSDVRVTEERIEHLMKTAEYKAFTAFDKCTVVIMQLENGFILTESSACVDPANYNSEYGTQICLDKLRDKLWELEGYALQKEVYERKQED